MSAQLRAAIYGSPRASFGPGYPTKLEAMQHYMWCLEVENSDKKNALNRLAENLRVQWSNMPDPKPVLEMAQVRDKFKTMLKDYWSLTNLGFRSEDKDFIATQKKKLEPIVDIEKRPPATTPKKRSIQEVSARSENCDIAKIQR